MKALITGVSGFVGSTLAERLIGRGDEVVGVDVLSDYYEPDRKRANLRALEDAAGFSWVHGDLNDVDLASLLDGIDAVFHQAGQPGVRKSWGKDFDVYVDANVRATQHLLEACVEHPTVQRVVYASSSSVYGEAEGYPTSEDDVPRPVSPYGVTKLAAEHLCSLYAANLGVPTISLRYFTVYGPRQRPDMAFHRFVRAALLDEPITVYGSGEQVRDFTFIGDVVEANLLAATQPVRPGTVLNVAGGTSTSVNEVLDQLEAIAGRPLKVERVEKALGDVSRTGGATDRIREMLSWTPAVTLEQGLRAEYDWLAQELEGLRTT
ncbi:NAD-dependent epimerase/dehydratase family protein [Actinomycetospora sp. C-140]